MYGDYLYDSAHLIYWWPWFSAWQHIDIQAEIMSYFATLQQDILNLRERILCYQLHIGLDAMAYHCHTKLWDQFEWNARRTLEIIAS